MVSFLSGTLSLPYLKHSYTSAHNPSWSFYRGAMEEMLRVYRYPCDASPTWGEFAAGCTQSHLRGNVNVASKISPGKLGRSTP